MSDEDNEQDQENSGPVDADIEDQEPNETAVEVGLEEFNAAVQEATTGIVKQVWNKFFDPKPADDPKPARPVTDPKPINKEEPHHAHKSASVKTAPKTAGKKPDTRKIKLFRSL